MAARRFCLGVATALLVLAGCREETKETANPPDPPSAVDPAEVADAYLYLLGRAAVLRQAPLDWNRIVKREPAGGNLAYFEAWIAVDERSCVQLDVPELAADRYATWQVLNGWGETVLNVNARTYPEHPHGRFALCLHGSPASVPEGAVRVDLLAKTARAIGRIERGAKPAEYALTPLGEIGVEPPIQIPAFTNDALPRAELFDRAAEILAGEPDVNEGMEPVRAQVSKIAEATKRGTDARPEIDRAIEQLAWPALEAAMRELGPTRNGWTRPKALGHYGADFLSRTVANLLGPGANTLREMTPFGTYLHGGTFHLLTFPANALPSGSWSLSVGDRVVADERSKLPRGADGSLTLALAPRRPPNLPKASWLETPDGERTAVTLRFYAPPAEIAEGDAFPPELFAQP